MPRDFSVAVTVAPEMTAPEASVTVPVILALTSCPKAAEHTKEREQTTKSDTYSHWKASIHFLGQTC